MTTPPLHTTYDQFPYPSYPLPHTHPDHLATVATLLGLTPAAADKCRVLELGCASGGNIIPMAMSLPQSRFVGIDLSGAQIAEGQKMAAALGLSNLELQQQSILDVDETFGSFDYVLCHGVYSWVPPAVQDKILAICARHLAPGGIGFVSYNTYPGWHMRGMVRAMLHYHANRVPDETPEQRVARARGLLDFLTRAVPAGNSAYGQLLREQSDLLCQHTDSYLFHEHLEEHNEPLYFLQFCERLAAHDLRYLGEAEFHSMVAGIRLSPEIQHELYELAPSLIEKEQYLDFLRCRTFRQTLICHAQLQPNYRVGAEQLMGFAVASPARPRAAAPDLGSGSPEEFYLPSGLSLTVSTPIMKAAMTCLGEAWPQLLPFETLLTQAQVRLGAATGDHERRRQDALALGRAMLTAYATAGEALVELALRPPAFATAISERPIASPLARLQAASGQPITSLRHRLVQVTPFDRHLLPYLDGTRDRAALLAGLLERFRNGQMQMEEDSQPVADAGRAAQILAEVLGQQLPQLAKAALLLA